MNEFILLMLKYWVLYFIDLYDLEFFKRALNVIENKMIHAYITIFNGIQYSKTCAFAFIQHSHKLKKQKTQPKNGLRFLRKFNPI